MTTETKVKERPIIFNADMVRAVLNGSKTQTRRPCKPQPFHTYMKQIISDNGGDNRLWVDGKLKLDVFNENFDKKLDLETGGCPLGKPGDRLWVREQFAEFDGVVKDARTVDDPLSCIAYQTEPDYEKLFEDSGLWKRRPSIHMPRWASRITLEITAVRVERLQDISEADALAEGVWQIPGYEEIGESWFTWENGTAYSTAQGAFESLWDSIYGETESRWAANPWVWVVEFERVK